MTLQAVGRHVFLRAETHLIAWIVKGILDRDFVRSRQALTPFISLGNLVTGLAWLTRAGLADGLQLVLSCHRFDIHMAVNATPNVHAVRL